MQESTIQKLIRQAIVLDGRCFVTRCETGVFRAPQSEARIRCGLGNGTPDLIGCVVGSGRGFCVETKTATWRLRPDQVAWARAARGRGVFVAVCRSVPEALAAIDRACAGALE